MEEEGASGGELTVPGEPFARLPVWLRAYACRHANVASRRALSCLCPQGHSSAGLTRVSLQSVTSNSKPFSLHVSLVTLVTSPPLSRSLGYRARVTGVTLDAYAYGCAARPGRRISKA